MSSARRSLIAGGVVLVALSVYVGVLIAQGTLFDSSGSVLGVVTVSLAALLTFASAAWRGMARSLSLGVAAATLGIWGILGLLSVGVLFLAGMLACLWALFGGGQAPED